MCPGYIDLDHISHLNRQRKGGGVYENKRWRESYYFSMTDPASKISVITTIGILPNRKLNTGLLTIIKAGRLVCIIPLFERREVRFIDYSFSIKNLSYSIEGTDWRLEYESGKFKMDLLFRPLNKIYSYFPEGDDSFFSCIGSQHYEQFGLFSGLLTIKNEQIELRSVLGHRDHSWGIRNWNPVDRYRLFCCAFSRNFAFNLWEGSIYGTGFLKGYIFDGIENTKLLDAKIVDDPGKDMRMPKSAVINLRDTKRREFRVDCSTMFSLKIPPRRSIMYESIGLFSCSGETGFGVQEYLYHEPNALYRLGVFLRLLRYL